jgi:hypothetical protein
MKEQCHECGKEATSVRLRKCPVCHKHFCEEHAHSRGGLWFCSKGCSEYFYFGDADE